MNVHDTIAVPRADLQEVSDLLAERKQGNAARSPAHNARLIIDRHLAAAPAQAQPISMLTRVWPDIGTVVWPRDEQGRSPDPIAFVLGLSAEPWKIGALGPLLRDSGEVDVPRRAEAEMAAALHWLIGLAIRHGDGWAEVYSRELARLKEARAALSSSTVEGRS